MDWKINFAQQALDQREQIVRLITQDDPVTAKQFWIARNHTSDRESSADIS